jgi:hypothetical protein
MTDDRLCPDFPVFPIIMTVALLIEGQRNNGAVLIFPFAGEDIAVT